jgi:hypothetical protein
MSYRLLFPEIMFLIQLIELNPEPHFHFSRSIKNVVGNI